MLIPVVHFADEHARRFFPLPPCSRRAQTPNPVLELEYLKPVNSNGRKLDRSIILHFLSMGEFVDAVMQDDFELGVRFFLCACCFQWSASGSLSADALHSSRMNVKK